MLGFTDDRWANRCLSSPTDGRSAARLTSAIRYSERDIPSMAALALSLRCRTSGTFRSWIILDMRREYSHAKRMSSQASSISEVLKPRPAAGYVRWLAAIPREEQFTSAVVVGELYEGAFRSSAAVRHLENVENRVLPAVTVLSYDVAAARVYGQVRAHLESAGRPLADADLQIAATALVHDLELVTGNVKHFRRVPGLRISPVLAEARTRS